MLLCISCIRHHHHTIITLKRGVLQLHESSKSEVKSVNGSIRHRLSFFTCITMTNDPFATRASVKLYYGTGAAPLPNNS
jgi:hypothetical protein